MYAIGSSYIYYQLPAGERIGGLSIKIWHSRSAELETKILFTSYTGEPIAGVHQKEIQVMTNIALQGIQAFAAERDIDLSAYKLEFSQFLYHPLDSDPEVFKRAGRNAFASAWATLHNQNL